MEDHASHHGVELYDLVIAVKALIKISLANALGSFRQALARLVERKVQETKTGGLVISSSCTASSERSNLVSR